jgi:filamentous hemagglutinin
VHEERCEIAPGDEPCHELGLALCQVCSARVHAAPYNKAMVGRLNAAMAAGERVTGADANFYLHEISEGTFRARGLGYDAAHDAALQKYGASPFSIYAPSVIEAMPEWFNNNWRAYWGIK